MFSACASVSLRDAQLVALSLKHLGHHVAPPVTAAGHLVQRCRTVSRELAEDLPRFLGRASIATSMPSPAIQRATAIVELVQILSKLS